MKTTLGRKLVAGAVAVMAFGAVLGVHSASAAVGVTNGDFETGTLAGWTASGTTSAQTMLGPSSSGVTFTLAPLKFIEPSMERRLPTISTFTG